MTARGRRRAVSQPATPAAPDAALERVPRFSLRRVRCECRVCGAHTIVTMCITVGGCCPNCGSYDLRPVVTDPDR